MKAFAQEGIGRPDSEEINNLKDLTKYLKAKNVTESEIPEIQTILVLLNEKTEIGDVTGAPTEIVHLRKLKLHIRQHDRNCSTLLTEEQLTRLNSYFSK